MSMDRARTRPRHLRRRPARPRSRRMALLIALLAVVALGGGLLAAFSPLSSVATSAATRINAGGPVVTDSQGNIWKADNGYVGGQVYATTAAIARTTNDALYQSERWGMSGYKVAVPAADTYRVRVLLAEIWFDAPGRRVFDVSAEGTTYLRNLDIFAKVGKNKAYSPTFDVPVHDGVLDIGFRASVDLPKVSAIEVRQATGTTTSSTTASSTTTTTTTTRPTTTTSSISTTTTAPQPAVQYGVDPNYQPTYDVAVPVGSLTQSLLDAHPEGTRFGIAAGTHRLTSALHPRANQQFLGFPGATLNGSKRLSSWTQDGARWYAAGQTQRLPGMAKPPTDAPTCNADSPLCDKSEDVFYDDTGLKQVKTLGELSAGRFYFDYANSRIYIADNPDGHKVETTVSNGLLVGGGADVVLKNLVLEKAGSPGNSDAVRGDSWTVENCEIRFNHGVGIGSHGTGTILRRNKIDHNGQIGVGGGGTSTLFENNELAHNNAQGFNMDYFAGGAKWAWASGLIVRGNWVHNNTGPGISNDANTINGLFENNTVEDNAGAGMVWEISYRATFRNNKCGRNGLQKSWVLDKACLIIYNSSKVEVYGNVLKDSGVTLRQDTRLGPGQYGPWELADNYVHDNTFTYSSFVMSGMVVDASMDVNLYNSAKNNRFQDNTYDVPDPINGRYWQWRNSGVSWAQWEAYGNDTTGSVQ
jgi:hypothetical protein